MTKSRQIVLCAAAALAGSTSLAEATGFAIREQSAYGQGSSFAGMAAGGSLSSMFWNPATLSDVAAMEAEGVIAGVLPSVDVDYTPPGTSDEIGLNAIVPSGYFARRLNDKIVVGVGMNGPYGLATAYDDGSAIKGAGVAGTSHVFSVDLNPAVSYQLTDWLAIAVGLQIEFLDLRYTSINLGPLGVSTLTGDDVGIGLTAGVTVTPRPGTEIGIGYRSRINHEIEGTLTNGAGTDLDATAKDFDLPDTVSLGVRQSINDRMRVMGGIEWANWSRFDTINLETAGTTIPLGFNYDDAWFFSAGAEYDVTPQLTVRGGIGYELSPIDDSTRTFRLPDNDRLWLSAGASYSPNDRWSFDAGYSAIIAQDTDILAAAAGGPVGNGPFSGGADTVIHIVTVGGKWKFGGNPVSAQLMPETPIEEPPLALRR